MQTLHKLQSGKLLGAKSLKISEDLSFFPKEIFDLADTLELLDLSNNNLTSLPNLAVFKKLKIAFFSNNNFTSLPTSFKECPNLYMLGFKANKIEFFDEDILPFSISWLILTDNKIKKLPNSMGKLTKLQKCALAGNKIEKLPSSMQNCQNLELLRLSANNLHDIPSWLLELPKLSWLAFSGNPCSLSPSVQLQTTLHDNLKFGQLLGSGASGEIYKAFSKDLDKEVAVKLFRGAVTSDGYAQDEMNACMMAGEHPNLIKVLAKIEEENYLGLLLEIIPPDFYNLGHPPNFVTCSRDTYDENTKFTLERIIEIAKAIVSASLHLHDNNLMHGDLYAHNILVNDTHNCYLGDFGAATFYDEDDRYEKIEVRAFGCLLDDMLSRCSVDDEKLYAQLNSIKESCMQNNVLHRPLFKEIGFD